MELIQELLDKFDAAQTELKLQRQILKSDKKELELRKNRVADAKKCQAIIQTVAQETQQELEFHISNLVTMALATVFPEEKIKFITKFVVRRNKTECDLLFEERGNTYAPLEGSGYGAVDVAAFALRLSLWALNPTDNVMVLDEPFRNVSPDRQHRVGEMLKSLSEELSLQIILVSHAVDVNIQADKTFTIVRQGDVSKVEGSKPALKIRKKK